MVVPVSQLVLPVGVMGLTVNGKTPTPAPGSIVRTAAVRFKKYHENTHKVTFGSENTVVQRHTQTHRGPNQCSWHAHGFHFFLFGSLRAASQGTQPFDVLQRAAQQGKL